MSNKDYSMEGKHGPGSASPAESGTRDDVLESLFSHASARKKAPKEDEQSIRNALHAEWQDMTRRRKRRQYFAYGMAASVVLAVLISLNNFNRPAVMPVLQQVAVVDKQGGNIFIHMAEEEFSEARRLAVNTLYAGQVLSTTGDARMAIRMDGGESIRLDENTRLAFISGREVKLISGRVYVDSHPNETQSVFDDALLIRTTAGSIRHLGTQYIAGLEGASVFVSVREGRVLLAGHGAESIANQGEHLKVSDTGDTSVTPIPTHGPLWEWAEKVSPEFSLDGRTAHDFITWVGRETGRTVKYSTVAAEQLARSTGLRGSIDLEPLRALDLILQTSDLVSQVEDGSILISSKKEA